MRRKCITISSALCIAVHKNKFRMFHANAPIEKRGKMMMTIITWNATMTKNVFEGEAVLRCGGVRFV